MTEPRTDRSADRQYLARRADQERALAERARDRGVAIAHRQLAMAYDRRLAALDED